MNTGASQSSLVQQMMGGIPTSWWSMKGMRVPPQEITTLLPPSSSSSSSPSSSSSSVLPPNVKPANLSPSMTPWHDSQELPESWSQLLLGGFVEEEDASSFAPYPAGKRVENWPEQHQMIYQAAKNTHTEVNTKQENPSNVCTYYYGTDQEAKAAGRSCWSQVVVPTSSPRSCITTSFSNNNMLDFSNCKDERKHQQSDHLSECNSTSGAPFKKAKLQASSAQSPLKVRKEKLGDRITALHQMVSPFGKTDTASVLLEAIGYIRFLQSQIEALSSPYLGNRSRNAKNNGKGERSNIFPEDPGQLLNDHCMKRVGSPDLDVVGELKDLRSRGLCLVPMSFTLHVRNEDSSDFWAPAFGAGFR